MKRFLVILGCLVGAIAIAVFLPLITSDYTARATPSTIVASEEGIVPQEIVEVIQSPTQIHKIYNQGQLIGVLTSQQDLDSFIKQVYREEYAQDFPSSSLSLGQDVYITDEQSLFVYENKDTEIFDYLRTNHLFTIAATSIEFSDDTGVYAEIFVSDRSIYEEALNTYLSFFIDEQSLIALNNGQQTAALTTYGSRYTGINISQTVTIGQSYADASQIMTTTDQVLQFLEYGNNTEREYYTVQQYDTVAGVGAKNYGLSATQIMNLNRDKITSVDQVLSTGEELCVTYFTSPIDITITMESMRREPIYPETIYQEDPTLREGNTETIQEGANGSKNTLYSERWVNGVLISGTELSSVDTQQPQNEILAIGTLEIPGVGTGQFRWPVDNPLITCRWGCYYGHRAIDIQNPYDLYGNVYAADRGTIEEAAYNGINGNYVIIDHGNGYETYYGHMSVPCFYEVGDVVDKGEIIGQIGMTGSASGPHVHFFIMYEGERYNPCDGFLDCR